MDTNRFFELLRSYLSERFQALLATHPVTKK